MTNNLRRLIHHYLLPHESNNFKAKSIHYSSLVFYILLLFGFQLFIGTVKLVRPEVLGFATDISVDRVLQLVNEKRKESNLMPLTLSKELSDAALHKASDMFTNNYWAHISPTGVTPWSFITSSGYQYIYAGENLAKDFNTSSDVVVAWMNSPTHRANILKPEYTDIGLAVLNGKLNGEDTTLVVQEFGSKSVAADVQTQKEKSIAAVAAPQASPYINSADNKNGQKLSPNADFSYPGTLNEKPVYLPKLSKTLSLTLTEFLLIILFLDSIYMWKHKTMRISGHSIAHIIFLGTLIAAMGATGIGVIL